jgi:hypothetical protein
MFSVAWQAFRFTDLSSLERWIDASVEAGEWFVLILQLGSSYFINIKSLPMNCQAFNKKVGGLDKLEIGRLHEIRNDLLQLGICALHDREQDDIYKAILQLYNRVNTMVPSDPETSSKSRIKAYDDTKDDVSEALLEHWKSPYIGPSCRIFREMI